MRRDIHLSRARLVAILLPTALLGGAIGSQYLGGLFPCEMCMWQRWPHLAAIGAALAAIFLRRNHFASAVFTLLAAFFIATSGAIGVFHAGVEYHWWEGFTTCSTNARPAGESMLDTIMKARLIRCDVAQWTLFGVSLAGFNAIFSLTGALGIYLLVRRWSQT
ncbi:disulfide bond formation protein B [Sphingobium nicotianae]|uniref:Disulfide bond formation protein B n=1 Tax=Sphingobium nicotianae TaxID=2782607 RepID=A0A9X1IPQ3_9SPHN|nr:disulfide bond formation protein B [Sphingobium nicotianae]MBT2186000.1 disulfide bond formation protein B [Sphingobium nicotianae]